MIQHITTKKQYFGGVEIGLSNYPTFNSPQEVGDAYVDCGFNLVSLANNHTLDRGTIAIDNSVNYWEKQENVVVAGSYGSAGKRDEMTNQIYEKNGIKYAFFSYTTTTNGIPIPSQKEYYVDVYSYELAKEDVEKVKEEADVILVAMHWGNEYQFTPSEEQRKIAEELSDLGVKVIIGAHTHVVGEIEYIGETLVLYSLGNFISGQNNEASKIGLMASLTIEKNIINDQVVSVEVKNVTADLIYTYRENYRNYTVYPFCKLDNTIFPNYETLKTKYEAYINPKEDQRISIGLMEI